MYALASKLSGLPIISLQTSETVGWTSTPVIDLARLEIVAYFCQTSNRTHPLLLMVRDIRQFAADCLVVDNEDELTEPDDIVRLRALLKAGYSPLQKTVLSDTGRKLGQVEDYTINLETYRVQKLYVRQSLLRAWLGSSLTIDRTQIIDITPQRITVRDATMKAPVIQPEPLAKTQP